MKTSPQEAMWEGTFGDDYQARNAGMIHTNTAFFARALARTHGIRNMIEFGAGTGQNIEAIRNLLPEIECTAVEINTEAARQLDRPYVDVHVGSMHSYQTPTNPFDLVLTKGLLIHIAPSDLQKAYYKLHACAGRYILICEYYAPKCTMIPYRGHYDRLWKSDFAGYLLDAFPKSLRLLDYGFQYHRDPNWPQDDLNWFLLEKMP